MFAQLFYKKYLSLTFAVSTSRIKHWEAGRFRKTPKSSTGPSVCYCFPHWLFRPIFSYHHKVHSFKQRFAAFTNL